MKELAGNILDVLLREKGEPRITAQEVVWAVMGRFADPITWSDGDIYIDLTFEHADYRCGAGGDVCPTTVNITVNRNDFNQKLFHEEVELLLQRGFTSIIGHGS